MANRAHRFAGLTYINASVNLTEIWAVVRLAQTIAQRKTAPLKPKGAHPTSEHVHGGTLGFAGNETQMAVYAPPVLHDYVSQLPDLDPWGSLNC